MSHDDAKCKWVWRCSVAAAGLQMRRCGDGIVDGRSGRALASKSSAASTLKLLDSHARTHDSLSPSLSLSPLTILM